MQKNCIFVLESKWLVQQKCDTNNRQTAIFSLNIDVLNIFENSEKGLQIGKNPYLKAFLQGSYKDSPKRKVPRSNRGRCAKKPRKQNVFGVFVLFTSEILVQHHPKSKTYPLLIYIHIHMNIKKV